MRSTFAVKMLDSMEKPGGTAVSIMLGCENFYLKPFHVQENAAILASIQ